MKSYQNPSRILIKSGASRTRRESASWPAGQGAELGGDPPAKHSYPGRRRQAAKGSMEDPSVPCTECLALKHQALSSWFEAPFQYLSPLPQRREHRLAPIGFSTRVPGVQARASLQGLLMPFRIGAATPQPPVLGSPRRS